MQQGYESRLVSKWVYLFGMMTFKTLSYLLATAFFMTSKSFKKKSQSGWLFYVKQRPYFRHLTKKTFKNTHTQLTSGWWNWKCCNANSFPGFGLQKFSYGTLETPIHSSEMTHFEWFSIVLFHESPICSVKWVRSKWFFLMCWKVWKVWSFKSVGLNVHLSHMYCCHSAHTREEQGHADEDVNSNNSI